MQPNHPKRTETNTMPPHLHPRSRMTSSLFATTVAASFLVVGLPHVFPCPAPSTVVYADGSSDTIMIDENGRRMRRRRRRPAPDVREDGVVRFQTESVDEAGDEAVDKRECPVPKPGGVLGEWLGFRRVGGKGANGESK